MPKAKANSEYEKFDSMMRELIKIPHAVIKAKLDAEKRSKQKRKAKPSASVRAGGGKD